jgi:Tfp pilus assembly protein PilN
MLWDSWIPKKYQIKSELCAIEACYTESGLYYHYTGLVNKNGKLEVRFCQNASINLNLPQQIKKSKMPLLLVVNGQGIIFKKVTISEGVLTKTQTIIQETFPTINASDFFIQVYRQDENNLFIALCRKEQVEKIINELTQDKIELAGLYIGAPAVFGLEPFWNNFNQIETSLHIVELTNSKIESIQSKKEIQGSTNMIIDGIKIESQNTLGFAVGAAYFMQRKIVENTDALLKQIETKHIEKNKLRFLSAAAVAIAFVFAVTNMLLYTHYFDKNNQLETEIAVFQGKYEKVNQLLTKYQKNKNLIENAGVLNKNKLSEFADKLAITVPKEVTLNELNFNPKIEQDMSEDSLVSFNARQIVISGNCSKSFIVNEWINVLKMQGFIKKVNLEKFIYSAEGVMPNFEIKLITD